MATKNTSKYPEEAVSIVRQKTFSWTPKFVLAKAADGEDPAKVHDSRYSRIETTLIDSDKSFVTSCIKPMSLPGIIKASEYAYNKHMDALYAPKTVVSGGSDASYSMKFLSGKLKGKTIAEVALSEGEETLKKQYDWLKENLEKFPKNKELMDAINVTVKALREGKLSADSAAATSAAYINIYESMKGNPYKPMKGNDKLFFVHDTKIHYFLGDNYPVNITIKNYYAPLIKDENGKQKVDKANADKKSVVEVNMKLTADEWVYVCYQTADALNRFSFVHANEIEKDIAAAVNNNKNGDAKAPVQENTPGNKEEVKAKDKAEETKPTPKKKETVVSYKLKTKTPMTQMRNGKDLAMQAVTENGEKKDVIFLTDNVNSVDAGTWSKFLNKTKDAGCTFTGNFTVTEKGTLVFKGFMS